MTVPDAQFIDPEFAAWSREFERRSLRVRDAQQADEPRELAAAQVALADHLAGHADPTVVVGVLRDARRAYRRFDPRQAARCLVDIAALMAADGDHDYAYRAYRQAAGEFTGPDAAELRADCLTDAGAMALECGEFDDAERTVRDAIRIYHRRHHTFGAAQARITLANVYRLSGRRALAAQEFGSLLSIFADGSVEHALCEASLAELHVDDGEPWTARPLYERAAATLGAMGVVEEALDARLGLAWVLVATGDGERGAELLAQVRREFESMDRPDKVAICDYVRAAHLLTSGDFAGADAAFATAAAGLMAADMHHQLAKLQWNRVTRLLREADAVPARQDRLVAEAVDTAVSALIAADYERFQFTDARRRAAWTTMLEHRTTTTFWLVEQLGSPGLLADLIETRLSAGVYGADIRDDHLPRVDGSTSSRSPIPDDGLALTLGAAALLATDALPLGPPPALVDDTGRVLLAHQRAMAAALDPELGDVLSSVPRVSAW